MSRIGDAFAIARREKRTALVCYLMAGVPSSQAFIDHAMACLEGGADVLEIGIPFSDPVADGKVIQEASEMALRNGVTPLMVLEMVRELRKRTDRPLVLMGYYNPIFRMGEAEFVRACKRSGADGIIVPDLPMHEGGSLRSQCSRGGIDLVQLSTPLTPEERHRALMNFTSGFLYLVTRTGVTGGGKADGNGLRRMVELSRSNDLNLPLAAGFGISSPEHVKASRIHRWLDAKEYLVAKATGRFAMTPDSANATFLYDTRPSRLDDRGLGSWSPAMCRLFEVDMGHLPEVVAPTDVVGPLLPGAAAELGLEPGTPIYGGGGDLSLVGLGSGAVDPGDVHVYMGTSGWVSAVTDRRLVDTDAMIASVMGARAGLYNYIAEQETSGKCMEWVRDHLVLDEVGAYLGARNAAEDPDSRYESLFELLDEAIEAVPPPGADGVLFAPWLHGNRSPFEDPNVRGAFFNIGLGSGKRSMIRAVAEGIAMHNRWQLESIRRKAPAAGPVRFVGGGARSRSIARIVADVTGEVVETVDSPQNAGALGAALLCARGLGLIGSLAEVKALVRPRVVYEPRREYAGLYDDRFGIFKRFYGRNKPLFAALNGPARSAARARGG